jgi:hypothetical protein
VPSSAITVFGLALVARDGLLASLAGEVLRLLGIRGGVHPLGGS